MLDNQKEQLFDKHKNSQSRQSNPNPDHDGAEKHVLCPQRRSKDLSRFETCSFQKEAVKHDRMRKPVVCRDTNHAQSLLNEVDIDFRIPRLSYSVVKQAENYRVRELVKKIENHPHRHDPQRDLQQNKAYNPFSTTSKKMIQDMGNDLENDTSGKCRSGSISNDTNHRVLLPVGGNGVVLGGVHNNLKKINKLRLHAKFFFDRTGIPVVFCFWIEPQTNGV